MMTGFDFVFALFSLLLGLGIAEILGGFSRVLKLHMESRARGTKQVHVGWLVPLLALLIVLDQLSFWMQAYAVRNGLPLTYLTMLAVTVMVGGYYLISTLVFPSDPAQWPDFDVYYDQYNRVILSALLLVNIVSIVATNRYMPTTPERELALNNSPGAIYASLGWLASLVISFTLIFVKRRWLNIVLLIALMALILVAAVLVAVYDLGAP